MGIRQRSRGHWEVEAFVGRDENGKRIRVYDTVKGKKADAEKRLGEILTELDRGIAPTKTKYKFGDWLDKWLQEKIAPKDKPKTFDRYEGIIRNHIKPHLGHIQIAKLTPRQVQDLETYLQKKKIKPMAAKGVGLVHGVMYGAMDHALRMELISRNPVALVSPPPVPNSEAYTPEVNQVKALLKLAEKKQNPYWECIHLIAYTGMRRGEALALEWKHVDLDNMSVKVHQSLTVPKTGILIASPKTENSKRTVNLDERTTEILRKHRDKQIELAAKLGIEPAQILFPRANQSRWTHPNTIGYAIETLSEAIGCPDITLRSLRHFHATVALNATKDVVVVSKRIGHSSPAITLKVYAHVLPGWQEQAAEAFADAMETAA